TLGARTLITIMDPLTKPVLTKRQLIGVYDRKLTRVIAEVLKEFKLFQVMVVCGENGLDEMNISGKTFVAELRNGKIKEYEIMPDEFGLSLWDVNELRGGNPKKNKQIILDILRGKKGAPRDVTIYNAAAALKVAGLVDRLQKGVRMSIEAIDKGLALKKLEEMIEISKYV
ncbi:MAG: anthranilate phosphoribosyltransferase, partial [Calditrichia bacterium]